MYDPNVFAVLTAKDRRNRAASAIELKHNSRWFCKATGNVALKPTIGSRETTPAEDSQYDGDSKASAVSRLVLPFDKLLPLDNLQNGLQLGTDPELSHVLLGHRGTKGVSRKQVCQLLLYDCIPGSAIGMYCC